MSNYVITTITTSLTDEMRTSILTLIESGEYHIPDYSQIDKTFKWRERDKANFLEELSARYPEIEIETESWYESHHYNGTFIQCHKNGKWIRGEVRIDYYFEWAAKIDAKVKKYVEEEFTSHFRKFDKVRTEPYILIDTNDDITVSHSIVIKKQEYKDIVNKEIRYPIEYEAVKQGTQIYVSIGFDMDNSNESENVDNSEDEKSEEFVPMTDDDLPFF